MEHDEAGTLAALRERHRTILAPLVAQHEGRIVKLMGDGVLAEFGSAVNAVQCGLALQERMAAVNASLPETQHVVWRMGINLGEVVVEGDDLFGDGVNVAARLQALVEPGGICISGKVRDEVDRKISVAFDDMGEQALKNMASPVRIYRLRELAIGIERLAASRCRCRTSHRYPGGNMPDTPQCSRRRGSWSRPARFSEGFRRGRDAVSAPMHSDRYERPTRLPTSSHPVRDNELEAPGLGAKRQNALIGGGMIPIFCRLA